MSKVDCSIIFPLLNEEENIINAYEVVGSLIKKAGLTCEFIFVDDGSTDNSFNILKDLAKKDKTVKVVSFSRNFGQQTASYVGFKYSKGKCAINMDIDLQENPEVVLDMIKSWQEGYEVITIKRKKRRDGLLKRFTAFIYFKLLKKIGVKDIDNLAEFRLLDRKAIDKLLEIKEKNIFLKGQINWLGFKRKILKVEREKRKFGKSKLSFKKLAPIAVKSVVNATNKPLYWSFGLSILMHTLSLFSIITFVILSICKVSFAAAFWLIPVIISCTATILMVLGFIGMYLAFTYDEVRDRPVYIIKETINIED